MKEELFKVKYERYNCTTHHTSTPIDYPHPSIPTDSDNYVSWLDDVSDEKPQRTTKKRKPRLVYIEKESHSSEETYVENYGNPLASVSKNYVMLIVEKQEHKVSLKLFWGYRVRTVGNSWFKLNRNVEYITVNTKTGDVYNGYLRNYQKKRKATKKINKNFFGSEPINSIKSKIRNILGDYVKNHYEVSTEAISKFMFEVDKLEEFGTLDFEKRIFKYYLDKKGIKHPNNFYLFDKALFGPKIRKILKKCDNKLIDAFMKENDLVGKKLKTALHNCTSLNIDLYIKAKKIFGDDWINQEPDFILKILNSHPTIGYGNMVIPAEFTNVIGRDELRKVFRIFKRVYFDGVLNSSTFYDHIRMYTELKLYGETDLRWNSDDDKQHVFREEHLNWTDKLQFYKRGYYERIYPNYTYDLIEKVIDDYYPVILDNSTKYNEESSYQSNCVKTYIGRPSSLIISLRKGSPSSEERATIEYKISNNGKHVVVDRVQSLGRFNSKLDEHWSVPLFKLDECLLSYIKDKRFETVKLTKKCANGTYLESGSEWDELGNLKWSFKGIEGHNQSIFEWI